MPKKFLCRIQIELEIEEDGLGFAQADNVRRLSNMTNRRGIFVAGGFAEVTSERCTVLAEEAIALYAKLEQEHPMVAALPLEQAKLYYELGLEALH